MAERASVLALPIEAFPCRRFDANGQVRIVVDKGVKRNNPSCRIRPASRVAGVIRASQGCSFAYDPSYTTRVIEARSPSVAAATPVVMDCGQTGSAKIAAFFRRVGGPVDPLSLAQRSFAG